MKEKLPQATLVFLQTDEHVLLAMKKRGFGKGKWNGVGGKIEIGESIEQAAIRECEEEIGVIPTALGKVAVLEFYFPRKKAEQGWNQEVTVFLCDEWDGKPIESEEMAPKWFKKSDVPYDDMWSDDKLWLPKVLAGNHIKADFHFDDVESIEKYSIEVLGSEVDL